VCVAQPRKCCWRKPKELRRVSFPPTRTRPITLIDRVSFLFLILSYPTPILTPHPTRLLRYHSRARSVRSFFRNLTRPFFPFCSKRAILSEIRGITMNLKDKANPGLRDAVVRGEVKALDLSTMSKEVSSFLPSLPFSSLPSFVSFSLALVPLPPKLTRFSFFAFFVSRFH